MTQQTLLVCALALVSVGIYGVVLIQLRRKFPERFATYLIELTLAAGLATGGEAIKGLSPLVMAGGPAAMFGLCLIAGKGSVATLVHDPRFGDVWTEASRRAQRLLLMLIAAAVGIAITVAVATA